MTPSPAMATAARSATGRVADDSVGERVEVEGGADAAGLGATTSVFAAGTGATDGTAGVHVAEGAGLTGCTAAAPGAAPVASDVDVVVVRGWMDTNVLSQIIRFGAYHHFVKNRLNWVTESFVFGRMS
jgi:hypothetical protein